MSIENADSIHELDIANPKPIDPISEGDNHIRLIKKLLVDSFPSDLDGKIVPDLTDNELKYLRVNEDGTAVEWHEVQVQGAGVIPFRSQLSRKDDSTIILGPGEYTHKNQSGTLSWVEDLELTITNPTSVFTYIYLDNSGTVTPSYSENSPTWSNEGRGWYLDDRRCIGAVPTWDNTVQEFYHDGSEYFNYGSDRPEVSYGYAVINQWTDIQIDFIPSFCSQFQGTWTCESDGGQTLAVGWSYRTKGVTGDGHWLAITEAGEGQFDEAHSVSNVRMVVSKPDHKIQYKASVAVTGAEFQLWTNGFYLPRGV